MCHKEAVYSSFARAIARIARLRAFLGLAREARCALALCGLPRTFARPPSAPGLQLTPCACRTPLKHPFAMATAALRRRCDEERSEPLQFRKGPLFPGGRRNPTDALRRSPSERTSRVTVHKYSGSIAALASKPIQPEGIETPVRERQARFPRSPGRSPAWRRLAAHARNGSGSARILPSQSSLGQSGKRPACASPANLCESERLRNRKRARIRKNRAALRTRASIHERT